MSPSTETPPHPPDNATGQVPGLLGPVTVAGNELLFVTTTARQRQLYADDIRSARTRVWLESYIFADDAFGREISALLIDRARAGLDVRLVVDGIGSLLTSETLYVDMRAAGVRVHVYRPVGEGLGRWTFFRWMNRRNHRKLLVVDDSVSYFGGMNVVDTALLDGSAEQDVPEAGWRDVQVRVTGPFTRVLADSFLLLWNKVVERRKVTWPKWPAPPVPLCTGDESDAICLYDSIPAIRFRRPTLYLFPMLRSVRQRVIMSMAYFVPTGKLLREIARMRRGQKELDIILPGSSDVPAVRWAARHVYSVLLKRGVRLYEYKDRMLHSKLVVLDDDRVILGSCNLDARSLRDNLEIVVVMRSPAAVRIALEILEQDRQASHPVSLTAWKNRPFWQKTLDWLAWNFRRWL